MIKKLTLTNHLGETLDIDMRRPEESGFAIVGIEGLGPPKATINMTEQSIGDGSTLNSTRAHARNIVMYFRFLGIDTELIRYDSYKYFPIKKQITLTIETDHRLVEVTGNIETNEPVIFSEGVGTQISLLCQSAYLKSTSPQISVISGVESLFEFPFSNESLTEDLIIFGEFKKNEGVNVKYDGDAEVGVVIKIHASGNVTHLKMYNSANREIMEIDTDKLIAITGSPIIAGDDIILSTVQGAKYITLIRDGDKINILNTLVKPITWFELEKGDNVFAYTATTGDDNIIMSIEYDILYEGV